MDRDTAIKELLQEKEAAAEQAFKDDVRIALNNVIELSNGLQVAKKRLLSLTYKPPQIDLNLLKEDDDGN